MHNALANNVLEQPGGPYNKIPFEGDIPSFLNCSGYFKGHSTTLRISYFISSYPPISRHSTLGTSANKSLKPLGFSFNNAYLNCTFKSILL